MEVTLAAVAFVASSAASGSAATVGCFWMGLALHLLITVELAFTIELMLDQRATFSALKAGRRRRPGNGACPTWSVAIPFLIVGSVSTILSQKKIPKPKGIDAIA